MRFDLSSMFHLPVAEIGEGTSCWTGFAPKNVQRDASSQG